MINAFFVQKLWGKWLKLAGYRCHCGKDLSRDEMSFLQECERCAGVTERDCPDCFGPLYQIGDRIIFCDICGCRGMGQMPGVHKVKA